MLKLGSFSGPAANTLATCRRSGVVLDFVIVIGPEQPDDQPVHRQAAVTGVSEACRRTARQAARHGPLSKRYTGLAAEAAATSPERLHGGRLRLRQFYGRLFDPVTEILLTPGNRLTSWGPVGVLPAVSASENFPPVTDTRQWGDWGFAAAFALPPYSLHRRGRGLTGAEIQDLFRAVVRHVLRTPAAATHIWCWQGDWSGYFEPGRQWWGAAAWTVRVSPDEIVTITASATD